MFTLCDVLHETKQNNVNSRECAVWTGNHLLVEQPKVFQNVDAHNKYKIKELLYRHECFTARYTT